MRHTTEELQDELRGLIKAAHALKPCLESNDVKCLTNAIGYTFIPAVNGAISASREDRDLRMQLYKLKDEDEEAYLEMRVKEVPDEYVCALFDRKAHFLEAYLKSN